MCCWFGLALRRGSAALAANPPNDVVNRERGYWQASDQDWDRAAIHMALLRGKHTGSASDTSHSQVLWWGGGMNDSTTETRVWRWDPADTIPPVSALVNVTNSGTNIFCAGHSTLVDGRLLVQAADGGDGWRTVAHLYPRAFFDDLAVDSLGTSPVRLVFLAEHDLRFAGRLAVTADPAVTQGVAPQGARHSRLGEVLPAVQASDGVTTILARGDTLALDFAPPAVVPGQVREYVVRTRGVYTSTGGSQFLSSPSSQGADVPVRFELHPAAPNPASGPTRMRFDVPRPARVRLDVFDVRGTLVRTLADRRFDAGRWTVDWDRRDGAGRRVAAGVYVYRLHAPGVDMRRRLVLF